MTITKAQRTYVESVIYDFFDKLDPNKYNTDHYKEKFALMSDEQFLEFVSKNLPYNFHVKPFGNEPTMKNIKDALDVIHVPLLEKVYLNHLYKNKNGKAVTSKLCLTGYTPIKKMKQFVTKKNSMSTDIDDRDMKTGLLNGNDKNAITSDREMEAAAITGLYNTIEEFSRARADSMNAKSNMYSTISTTGSVSLKDCKADIDDSLSKNLIDVYFTGALLKTNILGDGYETPRTLKDKDKRIQRM